MRPLNYAVNAIVVTAIFASLFFFMALILLAFRPTLRPPAHSLFMPYPLPGEGTTCYWNGNSMNGGDLEGSYYCSRTVTDGLVDRAGYSYVRGELRRVYLAMQARALTVGDLLLDQGYPAAVRKWRRTIFLCWPRNEGQEYTLSATIRRSGFGTLYSRYGGTYRAIQRWFETTLNGMRGSVGYVSLEFNSLEGGRCS